MLEKITKRISYFLIGLSFISILSSNVLSLSHEDEDLPPLLEAIPTTPYDILSPVGAGMKTVEEARHQLQVEAKKVQAEAVVGVFCTPGGMARSGLTWFHKDAYCKGTAIRYRQHTPK